MKSVSAKFAGNVLLIALILTLNGCMTCRTLDSAKTKTHHDDQGQVIVDQKGHPGECVLLLITVPADIVTSPFQAMFIGFIGLTMAGYQG